MIKEFSFCQMPLMPFMLTPYKSLMCRQENHNFCHWVYHLGVVELYRSFSSQTCVAMLLLQGTQSPFINKQTVYISQFLNDFFFVFWQCQGVIGRNTSSNAYYFVKQSETLIILANRCCFRSFIRSICWPIELQTTQYIISFSQFVFWRKR